MRRSQGGGGTESPPRARGRDLRLIHRLPLCGITPACAGKSGRPTSQRLRSWNHPRVRGEEEAMERGMLIPKESPPRARGRVTVWSMVTQDEGITPACAGKSLRLPRLAGLVGNHPRVRGEELYLALRLEWQIGITPACAGKSQPSASFLHHDGNHPRVRGEEHHDDFLPLYIRESPPRARGRGGTGSLDRVHHGITPACAGKSSSGRKKCHARSRNHPRVRGEESNENAASEDMVIPPKCKFFALFSRAALKRRVIPNAGPGAFRLSNFCLYSSLCVPA